MTDREMLEFAAKAAGMRVGYEPDGKERGRYDLYWSNVHHQLAWHGKSAGSEYPRPIFWNPLTDDGDALRLAVKLDLSSLMVFSYPGNQKRREFWSPNSGTDGGRSATTEAEYAADPLAATRRAITRAAAEIGKGMK